MKKSVFLLFFIVLFAAAFVFAQTTDTVPAETAPTEIAEIPTETSEETASAEAGFEIDFESETTVEEDEGENEILEEIEKEHADSVEETNAGITPDSAFYFIESGIFEKFRNDIANMRKKMAEIRKLIQENKIEEAKISLEKLKEYAKQVEAEADPEMRDEIRQAIAEILRTIEQFENTIPDEYKKEFVDDILDASKNVATAAEIAAKINELCSQLIKLGEFKKADEVCKLGDNEEQESPDWLKRKRGEWKKEMSDDAQKFFEVLNECMEITSDDIEGNYDQCRCGEMPSAQQELCYQIAKTEDEGGDASSLIEQFMKGLPNDLKIAVEQSMSQFEEAGFERSRPQGCEDIDFKECMELEFRKRAPGPCLNALDRGEIEPTKEACEEIMYKERAPQKCKDKGITNPDECAELFEGDFEKESGGSGPGFDVSAVCNNIKNSQSRLDCYDSNIQKVGGLRNYYDERHKFRDEFSDDFSGTFDEHKEEFEKEFSDKYNDKYKREQDLIRASDARFRKTQDYQEQFAVWCGGKGGRWDCSFASVSPESPCRCFGSAQKEPQYDYDFDKYFSGEHREEFRERSESELGSLPSEEFQPPEGFELPEGFQPPETFASPTEESVHTESSSGSGTSSGSFESGSSASGSSGITGQAVAGNDFLDYYFR